MSDKIPPGCELSPNPPTCGCDPAARKCDPYVRKILHAAHSGPSKKMVEAAAKVVCCGSRGCNASGAIDDECIAGEAIIVAKAEAILRAALLALAPTGRAEIVEAALARGYCHPDNSHKELDAVLIKAMTTEVHAALSSRSPAPADDSAELHAFGASHVACYLWPDDTAEHRTARVAYCQGAADAASADGWTCPDCSAQNVGHKFKCSVEFLELRMGAGTRAILTFTDPKAGWRGPFVFECECLASPGSETGLWFKEAIRSLASGPAEGIEP